MKRITVGTQFRYSYADANPLWEVKASRGRGTWDCVIVDCPDYSGTKKVFSSEEINCSVGLAKMWQKSGDESDAFFNGLTPGSVVHYNNGFNQYVRCVVTPEKQLLPIALVGEWKPFDLPKRQRDGSVYLGYHAQNIKDKKPFRPHASNVYEFNVGRRRDSQPIRFDTWIDPIGLSPISLEVPAMTNAETENAHLWQLIDSARGILEVDEKNPRLILSRLKHLVS